MSRFLVNGLRCDWPACSTAIITRVSKHVPWTVTVEQAVGWYTVNRKDYCPEHAAKARRDKR